MGTWSSGPFDNDQAMDLLDELAEMDEDQKAEHFREVFTNALSSSPSERVWPKEVVAAAAVVALALPGGAVVVNFEEGDFDPDAEENAEDEWSAAILREPGSALAGLALEALSGVTRAGGEWFSSWLLEDDRDAAVVRVDSIARVLRSAIS
ncbi:DUF4259 domain-containing protein [Micromonospora sp. NPDC093277]|uniref:DUF4259 domain-containing protein n=1 Tax=Micromonospora sp. NPDC093277 TaxID=3364291 RepID=UPI0038130188